MIIANTLPVNCGLEIRFSSATEIGVLFFNTFVGSASNSVLLLSKSPESLNNKDVWTAAVQTPQSIIYWCAFVCATQREPATCMSQCLANLNLQGSLRGYVPGYPDVYYVYTLYGPTDDLPAGTTCSPDKICGQTLQNNDHNKGIYNNLHRTISIRLGDMSGIAASSNPLSFGKLYYRLMTQNTSGNWISSATRGEQWMLIWSPTPSNGGCTIASDKDNSCLIETIFLLLSVTIFLEVAKYAKRH